MYKENDVHSPERGIDKSDKDAVMDRMHPMLGEQLMREYILGMGDTNEILNIYCGLFGMTPDTNVRIILQKPLDAVDFDDYFFIKNTTRQYFGAENLILSTVINDYLLIVTTTTNETTVVDRLDKIRSAVKKCYDLSLMSVYSGNVYLSDVQSAYDRIKVCVGYSFYSDCDKTFNEKDIKINGSDMSISPEYSVIEHAVRSGDIEKVKIHINAFFKKLRKALPVPTVAKTYCLELYVCIIRCCKVENIDRYMRGIMWIQDSKSLDSIKDYVEEKGTEITENNAPERNKVYSSLIRDTINIIDDNLENENLSLRWLAGTILYTNVDYLGKLFKKETGKNFSHYVMEKRMEMAKDLILEGKMDRIYEVAENVGYGSNSQYFSQVFKKYTGVSPLEYKEFARLSREKKSANNS